MQPASAARLDSACVQRAAPGGSIELAPATVLEPAALAEILSSGRTLAWGGPARGWIGRAPGPGVDLGPELDRASLAGRIDHTLLAPEATPAAVERMCEEALAHHCASVCVHEAWVATCSGLLRGAPVRVGTVIDFPHGASHPAIQLAACEQALADGASELDLVLFVGALKAGLDGWAARRVAAAAERAHAAGARIKVILETCLLNEAEKVRATRLAVEAGADWVKTSTGYGSGGATVEDVALLQREAGGRAEVKASGGIRELAQAIALLASGATRLGTSRGLALLAALPNSNTPSPSQP